MSEPKSNPPSQQPSTLLYKQKSLSSDTYRDEAWLRRRNNSKKKRSKSVTDDDLDELKACLELGFGFNSPDLDRKLSDTLPALGLYFAVNKQYNASLSSTTTCSSTSSDCDPSSPLTSPNTIFDTGENNNPQLVKARLKQWAQLVACSVRHSC
ncbi:putative membrane insertase [Thalictrum thalictroides]|uniref:Putative membrane insertase n=1 Tax=Thalictrum thalictroides TaxID=46969 RepID=A0A7J6VYN2_THATH|nr:putative membrane insertase [Thalictrum thalictroides]